MKKVMKALIRVVITCAFAVTPAFAAMTVQVHQNSYSYGRGGEFTAVVTGDPIPYFGYSTSTSTSNSFETFCIEETEVFYPTPPYNVTYYVTLNGKAVQGGTGSDAGDPLSVGAAYLYDKFATGTLTGYRYGGTATERRTDAGNLQTALWWLEDEVTLADPLANPFLHLLGNDLTALTAAKTNNELYPVKVMNLWINSNGTGYAQDMLVRVPLPGSILLGVFAVGLAGRKLRKFV